MFEDYRHMYEQATSEDGRWLNLKSEGRVYRVRLREVCTIQALNKEIEFSTMERSIRIYSSMAAVEKMLDSSFIRVTGRTLSTVKGFSLLILGKCASI